MTRIIKTLLISFITLTAFYSISADAKCVRITKKQTGADVSGLGTGLGNINMTSAYLQPVGTVLASSVTSWTQSPLFPDPDEVLYECDAADKGSIFELFATNGDDRHGGFFDIGKTDGYENYYATWFPYTAIRFTHMNSGQVFTRYWQRTPITTYATTANGKIQIRVRDISAMKVDLIKVSTLPPRSGAASAYCGSGMAPVTGTSTYRCTQPNAYVIFEGPTGYVYPKEGTDSAYHYEGFNYVWWMSIGMNGSPVSSYSHDATCAARNVTPLVQLPRISAGQLKAGQTVSSAFDITVECDNAVVSGVGTAQTSVGLQTSQEAYRKAQQLGLINSAGGVEYLLSDGYGTVSSVATGVGIRLSNAVTGQQMPFVGWSGCNGSTPCSANTANQAGWFPVLSGASSAGSSATGYTSYLIRLTATLIRLPGQQAQPGNVDAKAYVLIKVQ